jgi:outer membrane protein assembly factor BamA
MKFNNRSSPLTTLLVAVLLNSATICGQSNRRIARVEAEGLRTLSSETVLATAGLKVGDTFSVAALDAAAQRLIDSGLFKKVSYRTRSAGAAITITFELEEAGGHVSPVVFDNFIWFSDEELASAVRKKLPSFDGTVPDAGNATSLIREALQEMLAQRKLAGTVEYTLTDTAHLFRVADPLLTICTLHFPGAHDIAEDKLVAVTKSSTDMNYSRQSMTVFPRYGLFPLYREIGHWRVTFGPPVAKPDTNPGCESKVDLTIAVNEGAAYSWAGAVWSGNQALAAKDLDSALGMKSGEVANGKKFDRGLRDVQNAYGKFGYIEAHPNAEPVFDDAKREVVFEIAVVEGPQYRMGTVEFKGVSPADAAALQERWKLKSGDIYDESYSDRFFREDGRALLSRIFQERQSLKKQGAPLEVRPHPNRKALTVDVTIEIKN